MKDAHEFCRRVYKEAVTLLLPDGINRRDLWTHEATGMRGWHVHFTKDGFKKRYWYGQAHCSWDAKSKAIYEWWGLDESKGVVK